MVNVASGELAEVFEQWIYQSPWCWNIVSWRCDSGKMNDCRLLCLGGTEPQLRRFGITKLIVHVQTPSISFGARLSSGALRFGIGGTLGFGSREDAKPATPRSYVVCPSDYLMRGIARWFLWIIKAAAHHLASTSHATFDPNQRFLIPQTFLPCIPTLPTGGLAIVADYATSSAGVATFGHSLGNVTEMSFLD